MQKTARVLEALLDGKRSPVGRVKPALYLLNQDVFALFLFASKRCETNIKC
jgi:hypothetical protein